MKSFILLLAILAALCAAGTMYLTTHDPYYLPGGPQ